MSQYFVENYDSLCKIRNDFNVIKLIEECKFYESIVAYREYIRMVCDLLDGLNFKNDIEYSIALSQLMDIGFFSLALGFKKLSENEETGEQELPQIELYSHLGINIVLGEGNCRHYSSFHNDVMRRLEKDSKRFYCSAYLDSEKEPSEPNHMANTIYYNGKLYVVDTFNDADLYAFTSGTRAKHISEDEHRLLKYIPDDGIVFDSEDITVINNHIKDYEDSVSLPCISFEEYHEKYDSIVNLIISKKDKMSNFFYSTMDTKREIEKGLKLTQK